MEHYLLSSYQLLVSTNPQLFHLSLLHHLTIFVISNPNADLFTQVEAPRAHLRSIFMVMNVFFKICGDAGIRTLESF